MLYMVIEHFKPGKLETVRERFRRSGRMLPDGVTYHGSWFEPSGARCFQLMEATNERAIRAWSVNWDDLMDFEIVAVMSSADFWAIRTP